MTGKKSMSFLLSLLSLLFICSTTFAGVVSETTARQVAQNFMKRHEASHNGWNGNHMPHPVSIEVVSYKGEPIAYLVAAAPSGHLLVAYYDDFSPVLFYSPSLSFDPSKADDPNAIESWIIPEIYSSIQRINGKLPAIHRATKQTVFLDVASKSYSELGTKITAAWKMLGEPTSPANGNIIQRDSAVATGSYATSVGPLLQTTWYQGDPADLYYPYNQYTPSADGCAHTLTGCIATATAQVMKYWNWPDSGTGSHTDLWNGTSLSASFGHPYNWSEMPTALSSSSTSSQIDAVARLMSDVGIAVDMNYGCSGSVADDAEVPTSLITYFKYKSTANLVTRANYTTADWMNLIKTELNAATPRVMLLSIIDVNGNNGHQLVIDGYQTTLSGTDQVHLNYGWGGSSDEYYDITNNWTDGTYTWSADVQDLVIGIEPAAAAANYALTVARSGYGIVTSSPPGISCGSSCSAAFSGGSLVTLTATPVNGNAFSGWSGSGCQGTGQCAITMNANITVTPNFTPACNTVFNDVTSADSFSDYIHSIACAGVTQGCGNGNYCPADDVTRAQMAAFIIRAKEGEPPSGYCSTGSGFNDVSPGSVYCKYIKRLSELQITQGCGNGNYCPDQTVTRGQMAAFLIRALDGENFAYAQMPYFSDVPSNGTFFKYVQKLKDDGITTVTGNYNIDSNVTRDQMAAFLVRSFLGGQSPPPVTSYTIAASSGLGGSMSPSGVSTVNGGSNQTYAITPSSGYSIFRVEVDGTSMGAMNTYTFSNVSSNHKISAYFTLTPLPQTPMSQKTVAYQINSAHSGYAAFGKPLAFPSSSAWSVKLGGAVSYPLIVGEKVFVLTAGSGTGSYGTQLYALNLVTGTTVWGPVAVAGAYYWAGHAYDNGHIFVVNSDGLLQSFDAASGAPGWSVKLPGQYAFSAPPTAANGIVYVGGAGSGGTLYAVDETNGNILWTSSVANGEMSSPTISSDGVFVSYPCQVYKFDLINGSQLWHYAGGCEGGGGKTAAYVGGSLYVRDSESYNIPIGKIFDASTGNIIGKFGNNSSYMPIPAFNITTGFFLDSGTLHSKDLTAQITNWSFSGDGHLVSAPIVIDQVVIVGSSTGNVYAVNAQNGSQIWKGSAGAAISAPDEQNVSQPLTGFGAGEGFLVVPAGDTVTAWLIAGQ